jgi:chloride channel protein, CIC family
MTEQSAAAKTPVTERAGLLLRRSAIALTQLRRTVRSSEVAQIFACALLGSAVGGITALLRDGVEFFHRVDFALSGPALLSAGLGVDRWRIAFVPALGGLLLGAMALLTRRFRGADIVDPVEANALYGGRMSLVDSIRLALATFVSNGSGASLGMEAGYTQLGCGIFSAIGGYFSLRRADRRIFVTAGAAAAIAAAFNAPLAGAFYGYELILGGYTLNALAPVAVAAVCGTLAQNALGGDQALFAVASAQHVDLRSYIVFGAMGVFAAGLGILAMMCVTWTERGLRYISIPDWLRPFVGGIALSALALYEPQVLGSGHGGVQYHLDIQWPLLPLVIVLVAKVLASGISVGSGFRGGLFSSSLFIGCLFGAVAALAAAYFDPAFEAQRTAFLLVGMASVAAAIVGAPFTMVFLVLEATGDFPLTIGVLVSVITAATIVRLTFGYSFSTWRFHARGLGLRGAHDIGWIADLNVARMMRSDPKLVASEMSLAGLRAKYPPGSAKRVFVTAPDGHYAGWIDMAAVHDPQFDDVVEDAAAADIVGPATFYLLPSENVRTALARFEQSQSETLPVLSARADPRVIGYMTEAYALKRYAQELERRRSAELGEKDLFSLGQMPNS